MNTLPKEIDFATVLASAVHDMKNSLCLLLQSIETLSVSMSDKNPEAAKELASLHYEASRVNTGLMQLLSLYRSEYDGLPVNIDECYLEDLFDDLVAMNENYILHKNMQLDLDFDSELAWYLDRDLINILLNDILINAMRYGKKTIAVKAKRQDGFLTIQVEDDGPGYPESMLKINTVNMQDFDLGAGRTGLGLFFARLIAEAHSEDGKVGTIHLENNGRLGGSVFTLSLP